MELSTAEKFLLLAHHPEKGRFLISEIMINYGLPGAFLMELSVKEKISIRDNRLVLKSRKDSDPVLAEVIRIIGQSGKPRKIKFWLQRLSRKSRAFKKILLEDMTRKKIIRTEPKKFLWISYRNYYVRDLSTREQLKKELKQAILKAEKLPVEQAVLLGLIEACKMHKILTSDKSELKRIKQKLKIMVKDMPLAGVLDETIRQVQAAIIAGITASTIAVTAGTH